MSLSIKSSELICVWPAEWLALVDMAESGKESMAEPASNGPSRKGSMASGGPSRKSSRADRKGSLSSPKALDLDDVLVNELGQFGWFQLYNICLVAFPIIASAFMSEYIFSAAAIPHRLVNLYTSQAGTRDFIHCYSYYALKMIKTNTQKGEALRPRRQFLLKAISIYQ